MRKKNKMQLKELLKKYNNICQLFVYIYMYIAIRIIFDTILLREVEMWKLKLHAKDAKRAW